LNGNEPVRKWLKSLDNEMRFIIGTDIKKIQLRWPLGLPLVRNLGDKLWEVRSTIPNGIARVIFMVSKGRMILLHGFIKKTQKTPLQDLKLAKERAKHYEEDEDEQEK
jgi:phage-related protein